MQDFVQLNPNDPIGHYQLGHVFRASGNYKEMFDEYNIAMKLSGPCTLDERQYANPDIFSNCIGEIIEFYFHDEQSCYMQRNKPSWINDENPDQIFEMAERAVHLSPNEPIPWRALGIVLDLQYNSYERALKCFKKFKSLAKDKGDTPSEEMANKHISAMVELIRDRDRDHESDGTKDEGEAGHSDAHDDDDDGCEEKKDGDRENDRHRQT